MLEITQLVTAAAALAAVVLGPLVSLYIAHKQLRASVVSSNRQLWLNALRAAVAEYLAAEAMVRGLNGIAHADAASFPRIQRVLCLHWTITLLLNPNDQEHASLVEAVEGLTNTMNAQSPANQNVDVDTLRNDVVRLSQQVFRLEWERVKRGD